MIIETKFNVAEKVFVMYANRVCEAEVQAFFFNSRGIDTDDFREINKIDDGISERYLSNNVGLTYKVRIGDKEMYYPEYHLFKSKALLLESL